MKDLKTKSFALINIISLLIAVSTLEFAKDAGYSLPILIGSIILFSVSGYGSVFKKNIWKLAHEKYDLRSKEFLIDTIRISSSVIITFIVTMSIVADFVTVDTNYVQFITYVMVYLLLFIPCLIVIFKPQHRNNLSL